MTAILKGCGFHRSPAPQMTFLVLTLLVACFSPPAPASQDPAVEKLVLVGPFPLGDIYAKMDAESAFANFDRNHALDKRQLVKHLNQCKVYLALSDNEKVRPRLLLEGSLSFSLKNKHGKTITFHIRAIKLQGISTRKGVRYAPIHLTLDRESITDDGAFAETTSCGTKEYLHWDGRGRAWWKERGSE